MAEKRFESLDVAENLFVALCEVERVVPRGAGDSAIKELRTICADVIRLLYAQSERQHAHAVLSLKEIADRYAERSSRS